MELTVYLAGEIHSNWRQEIKKLANQKNLPVSFKGPMENHEKKVTELAKILLENNLITYLKMKLPQALTICGRTFG